MNERCCWNCDRPSNEEHFCPGCGKLQFQRQAADYFSFFSLPRKLNLDSIELENIFYTLSRKLHPDNYYQATEREKQASLDKTAILNDAYRVLKEPVSRAQYLLKLEGEKTEENQKNAPPEILEEVFELNEWLAELKAANSTSAKKRGHLEKTRGRLEKLKLKFESQVNNFRQELQSLSESWDRSIDAGFTAKGKCQLLGSLAQLLSKRNYLRNLLRDVDGVLSVSEVDIRFNEREKIEQVVPKLEIRLNSR